MAVNKPILPGLPERRVPSGGLEPLEPIGKESSIEKESSIKKDPESFFKAVIFGPKGTKKETKAGPGAKPKRATPGDLFSGYKSIKKGEKAKTPEKLDALFSKKQTSKERWKVREFWRGIRNPKTPKQKEHSKEYLKHMPSNIKTEPEFVKWLEQDLVGLGQKYISGENLDKAIRELDKKRWKETGEKRRLMEKRLNIYKKMRGRK